MDKEVQEQISKMEQISKHERGINQDWGMKHEQSIKQKQKDSFAEQDLYDKFEFRNIRADEAEQAAEIERICFSPDEACSSRMMYERIEKAPELFLVAVDRSSGKIAGFLNGISTDEHSFRDEFFSDASLHDVGGKNIMLLGLDVLPEYRGQGLASELMRYYVRREGQNGKRRLVLTCSQSKVKMYEKMGFHDDGISTSSWGGSQWHEMRYVLHA